MIKLICDSSQPIQSQSQVTGVESSSDEFEVSIYVLQGICVIDMMSVLWN